MKTMATFSLILLVYFGQAQTTPILFEPGLISDGGVFGLTISPDSKTAFWVSSGGRRDTLKIMQSTKRNGKWTTPVLASFSIANGSWKDIDPVFSPDGKMVLFQSTRPVPSKPDRKGFDIWAVKIIKNGWSEPYHLGNEINTDVSESYASMARNGNIYFMKESDIKEATSDIFVSEFVDGKYQAPKNIGSPVNTNDRESNPFISANEDYLVYFSSSNKGFGDVDLYISFKNKEGWTPGLNLGNSINSSLAEFCPFVHEKEKRLYFARQKKNADGSMTENLYYVNFDIDKYRSAKQ